jgi:hypothetical protein
MGDCADGAQPHADRFSTLRRRLPLAESIGCAGRAAVPACDRYGASNYAWRRDCDDGAERDDRSDCDHWRNRHDWRNCDDWPDCDNWADRHDWPDRYYWPDRHNRPNGDDWPD